MKMLKLEIILSSFVRQQGAYGKYVITGYKQTDETDYSPKVHIPSGGIGSKYVVVVVTSEYGKPLGTTFEF